MHANKQEDVDYAEAGDIVAAIGLSDTVTGDTICDEEQPDSCSKTSTSPSRSFSSRSRPKPSADEQKMTDALVKLATEDPTFKVRNDAETGQTIIGGMGELHLEIMVDRMKREYAVEANIGKRRRSLTARRFSKPRETTTRYKHVKQSGGSGQYRRTSCST